jgi:hypothetical protein
VQIFHQTLNICVLLVAAVAAVMAAVAELAATEPQSGWP